jgi:hypothetical protein
LIHPQMEAEECKLTDRDGWVLASVGESCLLF